MSQDQAITSAPTTSPGLTPIFSDEVNPMIRKAVEKHLREWEGLMDRYAGRWAIYHGDERLEIGRSQEKLYRKYLDRGLKWEELVVLGIRPPIEYEHDR